MSIIRRLPSYSIRSMLVGTAAIAAFLGWYVEAIWPQERAVNEILETGGEAGYDAWMMRLRCIRERRIVKGDDRHFWLDCRHHVTHVTAYDGGNPHELCRHLTALPRLESLLVEGARFSDEEVAFLLAMPKLISLGIGHTSITDQGVRRLCGLKRLEIVEFPERISEATISEFRKALPNCEVFRAESGGKR